MKQLINMLLLALCLTKGLSGQEFRAYTSSDSTAHQATNLLPTAASLSILSITGRTWADDVIYQSRQQSIPHFCYHYDDYLQYAPLATQLTMRAFGLQGRSERWSQTLIADASASLAMASVVLIGKNLTQVLRPDQSTYNSFPSGHTATAFMSAALLDLEYGQRYPIVAALGYASAIGVGAGRIMNNRHWYSDVTQGAAVGLAAAQLGYIISDLITQRPTTKTTTIDQPSQWFITLGHASSATLSKNDDTHAANELIGFAYRWNNHQVGIEQRIAHTQHPSSVVNLSHHTQLHYQHTLAHVNRHRFNYRIMAGAQWHAHNNHTCPIVIGCEANIESQSNQWRNSQIYLSLQQHLNRATLNLSEPSRMSLLEVGYRILFSANHNQ